MEILVADVKAMSRAVSLLATLDKDQFTKDQRQIITEAVAAVANAEAYRQRGAERNRDFLREKRKVVPGYNYPKYKVTGNPVGRPKKKKEES